jgi:hypothetical protein
MDCLRSKFTQGLFALAWLVATLSIARAEPPAPSPDELAHAIEAGLPRVEEFAYIREQAQKLGVRVWLFGGTAAGFGHYAKWDLQRQKGDTRYQPERLDYQYTSIFRSTQDADLVIDGTPEQAAALETALREKYDHLQGSKSVWEVRLLKQDRGDKQRLLNSPDFHNQHTDSNSTGMIELTEPPKGDSRVRDLRDWKNPRAAFFEDVRLGQLHFYFSDLHGTTSRFKDGMNPPILSVVRYLTKAFQYELKIEPGDWSRIQQIVLEFDFNKDLNDVYVRKWLEKNGPKLIQHAVNIEYAADQMDRLGLRSLLRGISDPASEGTLGWWMNKQPLRSKPVGRGNGKTAAALGITTITHETRGYLPFESITRAHTGAPNALISRVGFVGERAVYGNGHYTLQGRKGGAGTGWSVRYTLRPDAREGSDFVRRSNGVVLLLNKAAATVIPEKVELTLPQYLGLLMNDPSGISRNDKGILERARQTVWRHRKAFSRQEMDEAAHLLRSFYPALWLPWKVKSSVPMIEWLRLIEGHPDIATQVPLIRNLINQSDSSMVESNPDFFALEGLLPEIEKLKKVLFTRLALHQYAAQEDRAPLEAAQKWAAARTNLLTDPQLRGPLLWLLNNDPSRFQPCEWMLRDHLSPSAYVELLTLRNVRKTSKALDRLEPAGSGREATAPDQLEKAGKIIRAYYLSKQKRKFAEPLLEWLKWMQAQPGARDQDALISELSSALKGSAVLEDHDLVRYVLTSDWIPAPLKKACFVAAVKRYAKDAEYPVGLDMLASWGRKHHKDAEVLQVLGDFVKPPFARPSSYGLLDKILKDYPYPWNTDALPEVNAITQRLRYARVMGNIEKGTYPREWKLELGISASFQRRNHELIDFYLSHHPEKPGALVNALKYPFLNHSLGVETLRYLIARSSEFTDTQIPSLFYKYHWESHPHQLELEELLGSYYLSREQPLRGKGDRQPFKDFRSLFSGCGPLTSSLDCFFRKQEAAFYAEPKKTLSKVEKELEKNVPRWKLLFRFFKNADASKPEHRALLLKAAKRANVYASEFLLRDVLPGGGRSAWKAYPEAIEALTALSQRGGRYADPEGRIFRAFRSVILKDPQWTAKLPLTQVLKNLEERTVPARFTGMPARGCLARFLRGL